MTHCQLVKSFGGMLVASCDTLVAMMTCKNRLLFFFSECLDQTFVLNRSGASCSSDLPPCDGAAQSFMIFFFDSNV